MPALNFPYAYYWGNNPVRVKLKGGRCRILARGSMNTILLEFEDGFRVTTSGNSIRRVECHK